MIVYNSGFTRRILRMPYKNKLDGRIYAKEVYYWRKENHICVRCGKESADEGYVTCLVCRMEQREKSRDRYDPEVKVNRATLRAERKAAHQCYQCGKPNYRNHAYCYEHYLGQKRANRVYTDRVRNKNFKEQGLCKICGKPLCKRDDGKLSVYCEDHYKEYKERAINSSEKRKENERMRAVKMRDDLLTRTKYSGTAKWTEKVNKMNNRQIIAIWNRINRAGDWLK